jgi:hypothetical protein
MALSASAVRDDFKKYGSGLRLFADVQMKEVMEAADRLAWAARREEDEAVAHEFDAQVLTLCNLQSEAEACISAINKVCSLCRAEAARNMRMKVRCGPKNGTHQSAGMHNVAASWAFSACLTCLLC